MGRSGLVGVVGLLLLLIAAIAVMVSTSRGLAVAGRVLGDDDSTASAVPPSVRATTPQAAQQFDRAVQDIEATGQLLRTITDSASAAPLGR